MHVEIDPENIVRATSSADCAAMPISDWLSNYMYYEFNNDACACFVVWESDPWNDCSDPAEAMVNPL